MLGNQWVDPVNTIVNTISSVVIYDSRGIEVGEPIETLESDLTLHLIAGRLRERILAVADGTEPGREGESFGGRDSWMAENDGLQFEEEILTYQSIH